ncbi:hypothetical protein ACIQ1D_02815 [Lysinibacillus xylanilyticus]|uniref:hypothetical protein n=1 Tax=Lysinibacillus xylanilyticus TaxID=582475 RepID=UPI00382E9647
MRRKHLPLPLRFRAETFAAVASLSRRKHLPLPLRFRAENICHCRFAFAQKTFAAVASLSRRKKHLPLLLCFRYKKQVLLSLQLHLNEEKSSPKSVLC